MQVKLEGGDHITRAEEVGGGDWEDCPGEDTSLERLDDFDSRSASGTLTDASNPKCHSDMETILGGNEQRKEVLSTSARHSDIDTIIGDNEQLTEAPSTSVRYSNIYILDVLRMARLMHISSSMPFFLFMFALVIMRLAFHQCYLRFIWSSALCIPPYLNVLPNSKWADFPQLMEMQSSKFEQLLDESVALSLEFGKAAFETSGMITTMIIDPKFDFDRANLLTVFDRDAKKASRSVIRLISRVGSAVDNVMAVNECAMRIIQDAKKNTPPPYSLVAMNPFRNGFTIEEVIVDAFTSAMDTFSVTTQRLILEVEETLHNLNTFKKVLSALHEAVAHGDLSIHADLMIAIGTILGGQKTGPPLSWLKDFGDYQRQAQAHVISALHILHSMREDMEDLRERVTVAVEFVDDEIPLHAQIQSIQIGLRRLQIARVRAKASIRKMRKLVYRQR